MDNLLNPTDKTCHYCGFPIKGKLKLVYKRKAYFVRVCKACEKSFTEWITEEPHQQAVLVKRFLEKSKVSE